MSMNVPCGYGLLLESRKGALIDSLICPYPEIESI